MSQHPQFYAAMSERRSTFLRQQCDHCAGKLYVCYLEGETPSDDNGSQVLVSQLHIRCDSCAQITKPSAMVPWRMRDPINTLFDRWERAEIDIAELERQFEALLSRAQAKLA